MFNIIFSDKVKTIDSIMKTIVYLEAFPYIGKIIEENLREIIEVNYKYKIVYIINNKNITILSVYKNQQYWQ